MPRVKARPRRPVGRKKKPADGNIPARDRIDLRADRAWVARIERQASRFSLTVSAYIKQATSQALERDEATDPQLRKPSSDLQS
jgi:hypothetical protein